ncbi:MAG: nitroreductase family protein [Pseudomonadota bacterium]
MFLTLAQKRRSIRKFLKKPVEDVKVSQVIDAALMAPSSGGHMPWEFVVVKDQALLEKLSEVKSFGSVFLKDAPLAVVLCADPEKSDVWVEDASVASAFILLAAESLGLGGCWIQIRKRMNKEGTPSEEVVARLLNIPENLRVLSMIALGYTAEKKPPHERAALKHDRVYLDLYGVPFSMS